jgi:polyisoprenoid-binding protein YceI
MNCLKYVAPTLLCALGNFASVAHAESAAPPPPLPAAAGAAASPAAAAMPAKAGPIAANTTTWNLDADHSEVGFTVKHMMVSLVRGGFHTVVGALDWNDKDVTKSSLEVTVSVASVDTHVQKRDDHLRSPEFFDAAKFPTMTYKSTKVRKRGKDLLVTGNLTIRDVTKAVVLTVKGPTAAIKDPFGLTRTAISAAGKISRKDFGLVWNKSLEAGGVLVGEDVNIEINAEFIKKM